ncbi:SGNH hydrolase [Mollisia scopiformis]|uniref:SGNH hydrolase n=1 Tax=Mollisia scopiformis TaxID=149040 RepID=A0A194XG04_MOLSC|nr:SGNH hydrolase [Mollisia scopiformis]KUJ19103.1 SGNH hydrolase [Mollisia scopiformis]
MSKSYPQFLLFGDSIIQMSSYLRDGYSFAAILSEHCIRSFDIINRGLSGYNTANAMLILQDIVPSPDTAKVAYLAILFGANDACLPNSPSRQHVPLEDYRRNIKTILTHPVVKAQDPTILLITPPPVNESQLEVNADGTTSRQQTVTAKYADAIREIVTESENEKVVLIDLHAVMMKKATAMVTQNGGSLDKALQTLLMSRATNCPQNTDLLRVDGLHLTGAGYKIFVEEVLSHVEVPPRIFPLWAEAPRNDRG